MAVNWTITGGSLPNGWTLTSGGQLQGVAGRHASGIYPLSLRMTDTGQLVNYDCTVCLGDYYGLKAYWTPMEATNETTLRDSSGNYMNGTISGTPSFQATVPAGASAYNGSAYSLNTQEGKFTIAGNPSILQLNKGTIMLAIYGSFGASFCGYLVKPGAWALCSDGENLGAYNYGSSTFIPCYTQTPSNQWYHLALSFDSGVTNATKLYINGELDNTTTSTVVTQSAPVIIGPDNSLFTNGNALLNDIRIYDRILSDIEINNICTSLIAP